MPTTVTTTTTTTAGTTVTETTTVSAADAPAVTPADAAAEAPKPTYGEVIASGFYFNEGPRFKDGKLYCTDMVGYVPGTHQVDTDGPLGDSGFIWEIDVSKTPATKRRYAAFTDGPPSGNGWLPDGRMVAICVNGNLRVETKVGSGIFVDFCDISPSMQQPGVLDFPNDAVVSPTGNTYIGIDFNFFNPDAHAAPLRDIAMVTPKGELKIQKDTGTAFPNGAVITPDGKTYIVAETIGNKLSAFDVAADGTLSNKRLYFDGEKEYKEYFPEIFAEFGDARKMLMDGMCLDAEGYIWSAICGTDTSFQLDGGQMGGAIRISPEGKIVQHVGMNRGFAANGCAAAMLDDDCNLYLCTCITIGGHTPNGANNSTIEKVKVPAPAARSKLSKTYCAGYC